MSIIPVQSGFTNLESLAIEFCIKQKTPQSANDFVKLRKAVPIIWWRRSHYSLTNTQNFIHQSLQKICPFILNEYILLKICSYSWCFFLSKYFFAKGIPTKNISKVSHFIGMLKNFSIINNNIIMMTLIITISINYFSFLLGT